MHIHNLKDMLIFDFGITLTVKDVEGEKILGVGHNLETKAISTKTALAILREDVDNTKSEMVEYEMLRTLMLKLDRIRVTALINIAYTLGVSTLASMTDMLSALRDRRFMEAYNLFLEQDYAKQDPDKAERLAQVLLSGTYNSYST